MQAIREIIRRLRRRDTSPSQTAVDFANTALSEQLELARDPSNQRKAHFESIISARLNKLPETQIRVKGEHYISSAGQDVIELKNGSEHSAAEVRQTCIRLELFARLHFDAYKALCVLAKYGAQPRSQPQQLLLEVYGLATNDLVKPPTSGTGKKLAFPGLRTSIPKIVSDIVLSSTIYDMDGNQVSLSWTNPERGQ